MLKRLSVIAAMVGFCSIATAQSVSYRLIESDPDKYKPTALSLDLINFDTYIEPSIGYGLKLETIILNRIMPFINYKHAWMDLSARHIYNSYPMPKNGLANQTTIDLGGVLFLRSKVKKKSVRVVLHSSSSSTHTYTTYLMVPSEIKKMAGVGGGIYFSKKALKFEDDAHPLYRYKSLDGTIDVPIHDVGYTGTDVQPAGDAYTPFAMSYTTSIYGGLHFRSVVNTVIRADGYGRKANAKVADYYIDLMYAPVVAIGNVKDIDGKEWEMVPQSGAIRHLGYKLGYSLHGVKSLGFMYYAEFGKKPGPAMGKSFLNNGTYITVGMGVTIASGKQLSFKHSKKDKDKSATDKKD